MSKIFLGIDPGFSVTGYAVIKVEYGRVFLLDYGYLKLDSTKELSERVGVFYNFFIKKINDYKITNICLETSYLGKNPQAFLKLGFLRGILYLLANQHALGIAEFAPAEIKRAITGTGAASKDQVAGMVLRMFPKLNELPAFSKSDVSDAIAISICGVWSSQNLLLTKPSSRSR